LSEMDTGTLRAMLELVSQMHQCQSLQSLEICLTERVAEVIWADVVTLNKIDLTGAMGGSIGVFAPEFISPRVIEPAFDRYVHQHPLVQAIRETGDGAPRRLSDFVDMEEFQRTELYQQVFKPLRSLYQIGFSVVSVPGMVVGIGINRTSQNFSDQELALSHLIYEQIPAAYHHVQLVEIMGREFALAAAPELTDREREILIYLRAGLTNQAVATAMHLSRRTIEKHLERLYSKLQVANRTAAVNVVWPPHP
jgi:DNA-binding CsgD family transcriptional regulator